MFRSLTFDEVGFRKIRFSKKFSNIRLPKKLCSSIVLILIIRARTFNYSIYFKIYSRVRRNKNNVRPFLAIVIIKIAQESPLRLRYMRLERTHKRGALYVIGVGKRDTFNACTCCSIARCAIPSVAFMWTLEVTSIRRRPSLNSAAYA